MPNFIQPNDNDIMLGRGGNNNKHSGNEQLRQLARDVCDEYVHATKREKSAISKRLVKEVHNMSPAGRFILYDRETNQWREAMDKVAHEKVSQVMRDAMKATGIRSGFTVKAQKTTSIIETMTEQKGMVLADEQTWKLSPVASNSNQMSLPAFTPPSTPWLERRADFMQLSFSPRVDKPQVSPAESSSSKSILNSPLPPLPEVPTTPLSMDRKRSRDSSFFDLSTLHSPTILAPKRRALKHTPLPTPPPVPGPVRPTLAPRRMTPMRTFSGAVVPRASPSRRARFYYSPIPYRRTPSSGRFSSISDRAGLFERAEDIQPAGLWEDFELELLFAEEPPTVIRTPSKDDKDIVDFFASKDGKNESSQFRFPSLVTF